MIHFALSFQIKRFFSINTKGSVDIYVFWMKYVISQTSDDKNNKIVPILAFAS